MSGKSSLKQKRNKFKLLIKSFRPLRAKQQQVQNELKEAKRKFDSALAGLEAGRGNLEREVSQIRKQHTKGIKL